MQNPTTNLVYHAADGNEYQPIQIAEMLRDDDTSVTFYQGTVPFLNVADPRRVVPSRVRANVRHPSPRPEDAFIEVDFSTTLSLPRDRCQPVGATGPTRAISTARAEAMGISEEEIPSEEQPVEWRDGTFKSEIITVAAAIEGLEPIGGTDEDDDTPGDEADDPEEDGDDSDDDDGGKMTFSLSDGPPSDGDEDGS
jgi:hypothetical protein